MEIIKKFWHDKENNAKAFSHEQFVVEFIGPNMLGEDDYENLKKKGVVTPNLLNLVEKRLEWEVFAEFSYNSMRGRSLERVGGAAVYVDESAVNTVISEIATAVKEEFGLRDTTDKSISNFVWGFLYHLKNQGGIYHEFLKTYIDDGSKEYLLNKLLPFMPNFGNNSHRPVFLSEKNRTNYESFSSSWYKNWVRKCFVGNLISQNMESELCRKVADILLKNGILLKQGAVYSLNPEHLFLTTETLFAANDVNSSIIAVPKKLACVFEGMPLFESGSSGNFKIVETKPSHWLENIYKNGDIRRVIGAEHTGLLERKEREDLEHRFNGKESWKPWFENLLSATPTLEMGIDIGDLSSVLLCQIPPSQANYLQRIGRAGRKDGNALTLAIAAGNPHDLYFYANPEEMFVGKINPPGVFLNASMVLFRQLIAFGFDSWVETGIDQSSIPDKLRLVLDNVENKDLQRFPYTFIGFINNKKEELFKGFTELLPNISVKAKEALHQFLFGDDEKKTFEYYLLERLTALSEERKRFKSKTESMKNDIARIDKEIQDDNTKNIKETAARERDSLLKIIAHINEKETLNFMTDEGLLPNYAFPESGVTLRSVIWRKNSENKIFEYERSASSAISEFAPESKFYATGHKVEIEQIDMKISKIEDWRFCTSCSYAENISETKDEYKECPSCADPNWRDIGQKMSMVRLKQVLAKTEDSKSRIGDDSEDREPLFYTKHLLPAFKQSDIEKAYQLKNDSIPFGFEFIKKVTLREINFGKYGDSTHAASRVAGKEAVRPGFKICKYCGKVQKFNRKDNEKPHAYKCEAENGKKSDAIVDCLYLYREFESEALRIMLPSSRFAGDEKAVHSIVAALQLGLKLRYKGKIDHLKITTYEENDRNSDAVRTYILLYDSIPGGTGYLHDLLHDPASLIEVMQLAKDKMFSCRCATDADKDGCYECLFAYRLSHGMEKTSRKTAVSIFAEIVENRNSLVEIDNISSIPMQNPMLGSELESRFIQVLKSLGNKSKTTKIQPEIVNGKPGYFMQLGSHDYLIEPQADLNEKDGVSIASRPDFLIKSVKTENKMPPIAIFLDGFAYHKNSLTKDSLKRMAIAKSGRLVWSLTWDDIESVRTNKSHNIETIFSKEINLNSKIFSEKMATQADAFDCLKNLEANQFQLLIEILKNPDFHKWQKAVFSKIAAIFSPSDLKKVEENTLQNFPPELHEKMFSETPAFIKSIEYKSTDFISVLTPEAINNININGVFVSCIYKNLTENENKLSWQTFWANINLFQFLPNSFWTTLEGLKNNDFDKIPIQKNAYKISEISAEWDKIIEEINEEFREEISFLVNSDIPLPIVGYEHKDNIAIAAEAEFAWPELKIAVLREDQLNSKPFFLSKDWQVFENNEKWGGAVLNYFTKGVNI